MKTSIIRKTMLVAIGGLFVWWASKAPAQEVAGNNAALQMPDAVSQVLELEQAKIADATIIAYINNSGTSFNLNAAQIVFLRQQGVSDAVITAMLTQPRAQLTASTSIASPTVPNYISQPQANSAYAAQPQGDPTYIAQPQVAPTVITQPQVTYVQTAAPTPCYSYYPTYSYYPCYANYSWPRVWWPFSWAWWGGSWHSGWGGGHGGSVAFHGGWGGHGTWGGGWHGSSGGSFHGGFHGGGHR